MRQIKFRVYDEETETMEYEIAVGKGYGKEHYILFLGLGETFIVEDKLKLMQYTGLKDKNGTEIYEGDILKSIDKKDNKNNEWIGVVEDNGFGWLALKYKEYLNPSWLGALSTPMNEPQNATWINSNCIIIGNIYENKNLLDEVN